jgi:bacteriorhodopsin
VLDPAPSTDDPWGEAGLADTCTSGQNPPKEADFDEMVTAQTDWCWACMNVNSPDVHSVWFVISQSLAQALMQNMYAGEEA